METETLAEKPGDVDVEALVDAFADTLAEAEAETLPNTLGEVK